VFEMQMLSEIFTNSFCRNMNEKKKIKINPLGFIQLYHSFYDKNFNSKGNSLIFL